MDLPSFQQLWNKQLVLLDLMFIFLLSEGISLLLGQVSSRPLFFPEIQRQGQATGNYKWPLLQQRNVFTGEHRFWIHLCRT